MVLLAHGPLYCYVCSKASKWTPDPLVLFPRLQQRASYLSCLHGGTGAAAEAAKEPVSQEETDKVAEAPPPPPPQGRRPGIRFPNRRTPEGKRISMLSLEEQHRYPSSQLLHALAAFVGSVCPASIAHAMLLTIWTLKCQQSFCQADMT